MNEEIKQDPVQNETPKEEKQAKKNNKNNLEIEKLTLEKKELSDKVLRLAAEMQNMNRRFEQEKANIYKYDGEKLVKNLLPIVDNFERAINMDDANLTDEVSKFLSGFKMIYTNLINTLNAMGVTEINALGQPFDPTKMEAIMTAHILEEESNVVIDVMQKGYMYNDKVIRVAMVKVNE